MGSNTLKVEDLVVKPDALGIIASLVHHKAEYGGRRFATYGKKLPRFLIGQPYFGEGRSEWELYGKSLLAAYDYAQYVFDNPQLVMPVLLNGKQVTIKRHGIAITWIPEDITWFAVTVEQVDKLFAGIATRDESLQGSGANHFWQTYVLDEKRMSTSYIGDSSISLTLRTYWKARHHNLSMVQRMAMDPYGAQLDLTNDEPKFQILPDYANVRSLLLLRTYIADALTQKVSNLIQFRDAVLALQARHESWEETQRKRLASVNFVKHWSNIKDRQVAQSLSDAQADWATIPIPEAGTNASRTWGIEVETVHAERTSTPSGWEDKYDGSLEADEWSYSHDSCQCDCDDCCEYDSHCDSSDCATGASCREYVSPILRSFNSRGLRQLCQEIGAEESNTTPGIHVHVGADGLTVTDITRLLFAYSAVSRYIRPLYYRQNEGYCHEQPYDNVHWWLSLTSQYLSTHSDMPEPRQVVRNQLADRYVDVNLQALNAHGTIEFRSMGPRYDYEHLVRWAWFCREMVNVSRLNIPSGEWLACRSVADVIAILRHYGSELPDTSMFASVDASTMAISYDEE